MSLQVWDTLEQGSPEWIEVRRGILTASTIGSLVTPATLKTAKNDKSRGVYAQLVGERISGFTEETYYGFDMQRGHFAEPFARAIYAEHHAPVDEVGFMARDFGGLRIGYSPDGLVGDDGLIEIKTRLVKFHVQTILEGTVPPEYMAQIQAGLLVSGRGWLDYISYCGGMAFKPIRVFPDPTWQAALLNAARALEDDVQGMVRTYQGLTEGLPMAERIEMHTDSEIEVEE